MIRGEAERPARDPEVVGVGEEPPEMIEAEGPAALGLDEYAEEEDLSYGDEETQHERQKARRQQQCGLAVEAKHPPRRLKRPLAPGGRERELLRDEAVPGIGPRASVRGDLLGTESHQPGDLLFSVDDVLGDFRPQLRLLVCR